MEDEYRPPRIQMSARLRRADNRLREIDRNNLEATAREMAHVRPPQVKILVRDGRLTAAGRRAGISL